MISAVIPTLNAEATLERSLVCLKENPAISEIIVADGASTDATTTIAAQYGARVIDAPRGRGAQLAAGAAEAAHGWLLFLHADTVPHDGWREALEDFITEENKNRAAVFRFTLDDNTWPARVLEFLVRMRVFIFGLPYGDQGLMISKEFYTTLGGFRAWPLMEDVDLMRRIGRARIKVLAAPAVTSAARYKRGGYILRPLRNLFCLTLYFLGMQPEKIARFYR